MLTVREISRKDVNKIDQYQTETNKTRVFISNYVLIYNNIVSNIGFITVHGYTVTGIIYCPL